MIFRQSLNEERSFKDVISSSINFERQSLDEFKGKSNLIESRCFKDHQQMLEDQLRSL